MAKEIKPDNLSGAARFLNSGQSTEHVEFRGLTGRLDANRIAELRPTPAVPRASVPRPLEKVKREFVLTRETDAAISEVVTLLRETTSARLSSSHVLRGLARLLMRRLPSLKSAAVASGQRRLPSTSPEQLGARVDFEQFLAGIFELAFGSHPVPQLRTNSPETADKPSAS
ncbi:MAG: hypothetical protein IPM33_02075 [Phycisphaerales bacterium]|nr:hypothetical protein [Phycisphaerales bacterium]